MTDIDAAVEAALQNLASTSNRIADERNELLAALRDLVDAADAIRKRFHSCCMYAGNSSQVADSACAGTDAAIANARAVIAAIERVEPEDKP